ncbi:MAG: hypothetical protein QOE90_1922 [Thermoplasmata archaeon]|jgi:hypothetical protein|nr:hypothetical protein [Thermoplasmata archaeon]
MSIQEAGEPQATVFVDGVPYDGVGAAMTAAQLLALAGHDADEVALYAEGRHGQRIPAEAEVPVQDGSRFVTEPR